MASASAICFSFPYSRNFSALLIIFPLHRRQRTVPTGGVRILCGPGVDHEIIQFGGVIAIPMLAGSMLLMFGAAFAVFFGCLGNRVLLLLFFRREN